MGPIITKNQKWEDEYESDIEHGSDQEFDEKDDQIGLFAPPQLFAPDIEQTNNWDILRIYTDIDEEVEYLEENYMPEEMKWHKKKRKAYNLQKVGYVPLEDSEPSSIDSYEERRGFEGQTYTSHFNQARDAEKLGFIPVNEDEEYDAAASKMLHQNQKENIAQKRKERAERESSVSSKISSIFRSDNKAKKKNKKKKEKKRRRSSRLSQLLSFGSKKDVIDDEKEVNDDQYNDDDDDDDEHTQTNSKKYAKVSKKDKYDDDDDNDDQYEDEEEEEYYDDDAEEEYEEESETSSERRRRRKREKKKNRKKKGPTMSSMNAPKPMQTSME